MPSLPSTGECKWLVACSVIITEEVGGGMDMMILMEQRRSRCMTINGRLIKTLERKQDPI